MLPWIAATQSESEYASEPVLDERCSQGIRCRLLHGAQSRPDFESKSFTRPTWRSAARTSATQKKAKPSAAVGRTHHGHGTPLKAPVREVMLVETAVVGV